MNPVSALRDRLRRYPKPEDAAGVRRMVAEQWRTIAQRTPTYLRGYRDRPGSMDRAQLRAEWIAIMATGKGPDDLTPRCKYMELGCGAGRNLAAIARLDMMAGLIGIDICPEAIRAARNILPDDDLRSADILALRALPRAHIVLTCGFLGHVPPADLAPLLRKMLSAAQRRIIMVEEPGHWEIAKGPRSWKAEKNTGNYVLWRHDFRKLFEAFGVRARHLPLRTDLQAPAATEMMMVERS